MHLGEEGFLAITDKIMKVTGGLGLAGWALAAWAEGCSAAAGEQRPPGALRRHMQSSTCTLPCAAQHLPARLHTWSIPVLQASKTFEAGVAAIPGLEVIGAPEMCVVAFKASPSHPKVS